MSRYSYNGRVRIEEHPRDGAAIDRGESSIDDIMERDDPEYEQAEEQLLDNGRVWIGGGAGPLFLLIAI